MVTERNYTSGDILTMALEAKKQGVPPKYFNEQAQKAGLAGLRKTAQAMIEVGIVLELDAWPPATNTTKH